MAPEFIVGADGVWREAQRVVAVPPPAFLIAPVFPDSYRRTRAYYYCEYREHFAEKMCGVRSQWRHVPLGAGVMRQGHIFGYLCTRHRRLLFDAADYNK